jgi:rhodanese-related sulfurtransferase
MRHLLLCLLAIGACAAEPDFGDIPQADLATAIAAKTVTVIDVNGTASWKEGRIPGAIDFEAAKAELAKQLPADKGALIVAYCGGPKCGAWKRAAKAVAELGYTNVKHFSGGISGWKEAKAAVESDAKAKPN